MNYVPLLASLCRQLLRYPCVHFTHVFGTRDRCTNARVGSSVGINEKCQPSSLHILPLSVRRSGSTESFVWLCINFIDIFRRVPCQFHWNVSARSASMLVRPSIRPLFLRQCYRVRRVDLHLFDCVRRLALNQCYWIRHLALGQCYCISQFALGQFYRISPFSLHRWCCISQLALSPPPQTSLPLPFIQTPPTSSSWSSSSLPLHTQLPMTS